MNLLEGDVITDVEEIDEGWWTGIGPGGKTGLFPCKSFVICLLSFFRFLMAELWFSQLC